MLDLVHPCFLSHLKTIKIGSLDGGWEQMYVVMHLLKRAAVLERIVLSLRNDFLRNPHNMMKVQEMLLQFPRNSQSCEFIVGSSWWQASSRAQTGQGSSHTTY